LSLRLSYLTSESKRANSSLKEIVESADSVLSQIDKIAVAAEYGKIVNDDDEEAVKRRKEVDKSKVTLIEALTHKTQALLQLALISDAKSNTNSDTLLDLIADTTSSDTKEDIKGDKINAFKDSFNELKGWVNLKKKDNKKKYLVLSVQNHILLKQLGLALKLLNSQLEVATFASGPSSCSGTSCWSIASGSGPHSKELYDLKCEILDLLHWTDWLQYERQWNIINHPKDFRLF